MTGLAGFILLPCLNRLTTARRKLARRQCRDAQNGRQLSVCAVDHIASHETGVLHLIHYFGGWQRARCSGGILANASGEQSMLAEGMASLLIVPLLLGITCVPPSILSSWCGVAAHAETVTTKTILPAQAIALFIPDLLTLCVSIRPVRSASRKTARSLPPCPGSTIGRPIRSTAHFHVGEFPKVAW